MRSTPYLRQLELDLNDVRVNVPWNGRSPRELTKVRMSLFLRQAPQKSVSEFVSADQIEFWPERQKRPRRSSGGAPLLLDFIPGGK